MVKAEIQFNPSIPRARKDNNFDFLRFLFAVFVVVSHSYPLSGNSETLQWIYQITNGQVVLASLGLNGFFVISGFFIFQSLQRSKSIISYFKKRFLRLFPGLFVVLFLTILLVPFVYQGDASLYNNIDFYTYLPNNLSLYGFQSSIKGVFDNHNYHSINGSLWTLRYEFSLYVVLSFLYFFRKRIGVIKACLFVSFILLLVAHTFFLERFSESSFLGMRGYDIINFGAFFTLGSLLASFKFDKFKDKSHLFFISIIGLLVLILIVSLYFNFYIYIKHLVYTLLIILIGFMPLPFFSTFGKIGDMSYGIYIYSFPVQQTLMYFFDFGLYSFILWSLFISIILGYLSWHLIEKQALRYKNIPIFNLKYFNNEIKI